MAQFKLIIIIYNIYNFLQNISIYIKKKYKIISITLFNFFKNIITDSLLSEDIIQCYNIIENLSSLKSNNDIKSF